VTIAGFFEAQVARISPPWLSRRVGRAIMRALGRQIDVQAQRVGDGVRARFPGLAPDDALAFIGHDRLIPRGPLEPATSYARRLRIWLASHRSRGGPYAMLAQLFAFWVDTLNVPIDLIYQTGRRYQMDVDGAVVRDDLTWSTGLFFDGEPKWERIWLFFYVDTLTEALTDEFGNPITDEHGDPITVDVLLGDALPDEWVEMFSLVPRTWTAAHIERTTIVLLRSDARLWGYPRPVRKWGDGWKWGTPKSIRIVLEG
jgi:hypothetical protein